MRFEFHLKGHNVLAAAAATAVSATGTRNRYLISERRSFLYVLSLNFMDFNLKVSETKRSQKWKRNKKHNCTRLRRAAVFFLLPCVARIRVVREFLSAEKEIRCRKIITSTFHVVLDNITTKNDRSHNLFCPKTPFKYNIKRIELNCDRRGMRLSSIF